LSKYLTHSPYMFLNDSSTRISANKEYVSVPLSIAKSFDLEYVWKIDKDPLGSDHLL